MQRLTVSDTRRFAPSTKRFAHNACSFASNFAPGKRGEEHHLNSYAWVPVHVLAPWRPPGLPHLEASRFVPAAWRTRRR